MTMTVLQVVIGGGFFFLIGLIVGLISADVRDRVDGDETIGSTLGRLSGQALAAQDRLRDAQADLIEAQAAEVRRKTRDQNAPRKRAAPKKAARKKAAKK